MSFILQSIVYDLNSIMHLHVIHEPMKDVGHFTPWCTAAEAAEHY